MFGAPGAAGVQTAHQFALDPDVILSVAGVHRLSDLRTQQVREVPELNVRHLDELFEGDVTVLGHLLESSLTDGCLLWLTHVTEQRLTELVDLCGPGLVHTAGDVRDGLVPIAINPQRLVEAWSTDPRHQLYLRRVLEGLDAVRLPRHLTTALDRAGVDFVRHSTLWRAANNPRVIAYAVVLIYSALRALPVSFVKQFHGNLLVLWAIDLITAIPYTWGVLAMVTARRFSVRAAGIVVTAITFCAPYIYFWFHGRHYPPYVSVVITALVVSGIGLEAWKVSRDRAIRRRLVADGPRVPAPSATG